MVHTVNQSRVVEVKQVSCYVTSCEGSTQVMWMKVYKYYMVRGETGQFIFPRYWLRAYHSKAEGWGVIGP